MGNKRNRGDQLVTIVVETPATLSDEQRLLLEALAGTFTEHGMSGAEEEDRGWFDKLKDSLGGTE